MTFGCAGNVDGSDHVDARTHLHFGTVLVRDDLQSPSCRLQCGGVADMRRTHGDVARVPRRGRHEQRGRRIEARRASVREDRIRAHGCIGLQVECARDRRSVANGILEERRHDARGTRDRVFVDARNGVREKDDADHPRRKRTDDGCVHGLSALTLGRVDRTRDVERLVPEPGRDCDRAVPRVRHDRGETCPSPDLRIVGRKGPERTADGAFRQLGAPAGIDARPLTTPLVGPALGDDGLAAGAAAEDLLQVA